MEFFANDLSIHGQFYDIPLFRDALARLMAMRNAARRFGRQVYCHRAFTSVEPIPDVPMQQAVQRLKKDEQRSVMSWLTKGGPFWDDLRKHGPADWLECRGEVVTDSAVGEAAYRKLHAIECGLVSVTPSNWDFSPVAVTWRREAEGLEDQHTDLDNWRDAFTLEEMLRDAAPPIRSWDDLQDSSTNRFRSLTFAGDCFKPLVGIPFSESAADRILFLLGILDQFARAFDADGARTSEGHGIYQNYFTGGENALFSDSSPREKRNFRNELTFPYPESPEKSLCCTWHGKERHMMLRLHFSWPIQSGKPVYVVYVGPKITKR